MSNERVIDNLLETVKKVMPCEFMTWDKGGKDYSPCSTGETKRFRLEGVARSIEVTLCELHQMKIENGGPEWFGVKVVPVK